MDWTNPEHWLPLAFLGAMGLSILIYAVMDGYDLGVGILMANAKEPDRDMMIASIGPFWDANETWLVLSVGLLLVAFPQAHGIVLSGLYLPVTIMLIGLILRGVAFDFRAKAQSNHKTMWDRLFIAGSVIAACSQGYMLGRYIVGLDSSLGAQLFSVLSGVCVAAAYVLIGACWLVIKTEGELQQRSIHWAKRALPAMAVGLLAVSVVNPLVNERIFLKWFSFPEALYLAPLPVLTGALMVVTYRALEKLTDHPQQRCWVPFTCTAVIFILAFTGLAYSFYPYVIPDQLTAWDAASDAGSLWIIFLGTVVVLPAIIGYTVLSYYIFRGKASALVYH
jgi:cytochrome d ubiquinol oxidase subunit II